MSQGITITLSELIELGNLIRRPPSSKTRDTQNFGEHRSFQKSRGIHFQELRQYQPMDDVRHMEWRVTARTGKPHIKCFETEHNRPIILLLDFNASMYFGTRISFKSVTAAKLAALIAWQAININDKVGGLFLHRNQLHMLKPQQRKKGLLPLLHQLQHCTEDMTTEEHPDTLFDTLYQKLPRVLHPGAVLVIFSDGYRMNADVVKNIRAALPSTDIRYYQLLDPVEHHAPDAGFYPVTNGHKNILLEFVNQNDNPFTALSQYLTEPLKKICQQKSITHHTVLTTDNLIGLAYQTFSGKRYG